MLWKRGWSVYILMRNKDHGCTGCWAFDAGVEVVGPDRLPVLVPARYSWEELQRALRRCGACGAEDVDTAQLNWRTRACFSCIEKDRRKPAEVPMAPVPKESPKRSVGLFSSGIS